MALAFDAINHIYNGTGTNPSGTHTPVGTPKAIVVVIGQYNNVADNVSGVTYGGVAMTRVVFQAADQDFDKSSWIYFLGTGIPTGAQTVATTFANASQKYVACISYTGASDAEVVDSTGVVSTDQNPRSSLSLSGRTCAVLEGGMTGAYNAAQFSPLADWTENDVVDYGNNCGFVNLYTVIASADVTTGYNQTGEWPSCWAEIAISEIIPLSVVLDSVSFALTGTNMTGYSITGILTTSSGSFSLTFTDLVRVVGSESLPKLFYKSRDYVLSFGQRSYNLFYKAKDYILSFTRRS